MRLLFVACLILSTIAATAQSDKLPVFDLSSDIKLPPVVNVMDGKAQDYSEVILQNSTEHGFDTLELRRFSYDAAGRMQRREVYEYLPPKHWRTEGLENIVQRRINRAYAIGYTYDERGNTILEKNYDIFPANSMASVLHASLEIYLSTLKPSEKSNLKADEIMNGMKRYTDSLLYANVADTIMLRDSLETKYNSIVLGWPSESINRAGHLHIKYAYGVLQNGMASDQLVAQENTAGNSGSQGNIEVHRFSYSPDGKLSRISSYKAFNQDLDSFILKPIGLPQNLKREQFNYYNKAGQFDSVIYSENNHRYKHTLQYSAAGPLKEYDIFETEPGTRHPDTILHRLYSYNQGLLQELREFRYFKNHRYELRREVYIYNARKLPVEMKQYRGGIRAYPETLEEQHLFFYGDAADAQTALERMPRSSANTKRETRKK